MANAGEGIWTKLYVGVNLSLLNSDTNNSQFFVTVGDSAFLDGDHVVFGKVISGMDTVRLVEEEETEAGLNT